MHAPTLFAACLIAASWTNPAVAQSAARPEVRVGDRWRFAVYYTVPSTTPSRTWSITSVGDSVIQGTENGEPLRLTPELNVLDSPNTSASNPRWLAFPLELGKRWRFETEWLFKPKGSRGTSIVEVAVVAHEKVVVPAGEFDAFKLASREQLSGTSPIGSQYAGETTRTYWYAPGVRAIIKWQSHNPYLGPSTVELVDFEPGR